MSDPNSNYDDFFALAFTEEGKERQQPFDYQRRLALDADLYSLVNVPTGAGKTNAILGAWLWRRLRNSESVGRRLVYCLPMRTLVEQTHRVAEKAIKNLKQAFPDRFKDLEALVLMGGDVTDKWDSWPERECILIGTQDMLLSRALNRGYALSPFKWPLHFGLLNNDCLWVFDEVQLMGDGLATTAQLSCFRDRFQTFGSAHSIWMSATLDREWLKMVDFKAQVDGLRELTLSEADRSTPVLAQRFSAVKRLQAAPTACRLPQGLAAFVKANHQTGTPTLVVVNRVARARETFSALQKEFARDADKPELKLIHSRFRPEERKQWKQLFDIKTGEQDRIIVATQVIEAGVDISSRLLVTDLAPYASLVQRFGRCNREGKDPEAFVYWVDLPLDKKSGKLASKDEAGLEGKDQKSIAMPYEWEGLKTARTQLEQLQSAASTDLEKINHHDPFTPAHVLRHRDLLDLFDTTPDLSGYDLDVSRFVRGADEKDVSVAWRNFEGDKPPAKLPRLIRDELCSVPIGEIKNFLEGNGANGEARKAWRWDSVTSEWRVIKAGEIFPGMALLLHANCGGYDVQLGWSPQGKPRIVPPVEPKDVTEPEEGQDDEPLTFHWKNYLQTLPAHSREAKAQAERIIEALSNLDLNEWCNDLIFATQHHDWGKCHPVFQETLHKGIKVDAAVMLAKSTGKARHSRPRFRHELASALALRQTGATDLILYLAACHHGKVRLSIRALPDERKPKDQNLKFARGVWDDDLLPVADLGDGVQKAEVKLDLEPMLLGMSATGDRSWLSRMLELRDRLGVFRLAFLECLIRAADVRASANPQDFWTDQEEQ